MTISSRAARRFAAIPGGAIGAFVLLAAASAQFEPPATVFGSISDAGGTVEDGLPVEAYIGDTLCGTKGQTEYTGDGDARVTVYVIDVVSESQTPGCGRLRAGQQVRIKIGDRFAEQTATWDPGPVRLDVTFGNATPVPIPTFTPTPTRTPAPDSTPAPPQSGSTPGQGGAVATIPAGSPGAGSPVATQPQGGITSESPDQANVGGSDDNGVPVWAIVLLVLGGVGVVGGGVGYMMSRNQKEAEVEFLGPDETFPSEE